MKNPQKDCCCHMTHKMLRVNHFVGKEKKTQLAWTKTQNLCLTQTRV